jgi:protein-S-isoprenylcysteine O-methyltransferase Ste14
MPNNENMKKENEMTQQEIRTLKKNIAIRFSLLPLFIGLIVLLPAGTLKLWQVYNFAVLVVPMVFVLLYFLKKDPILFVLRILNEEKVLSDQLQGYKEYCEKTRYRLLPGIW